MLLVPVLRVALRCILERLDRLLLEFAHVAHFNPLILRARRRPHRFPLELRPSVARDPPALLLLLRALGRGRIRIDIDCVLPELGVALLLRLRARDLDLAEVLGGQRAELGRRGTLARESS